MYVGVAEKGLFRISPGEDQLKPLPHPAISEEGGVSALAVGSSGRIWIGCSRGGLYYLDPGQQIRPYPNLSAKQLGQQGVVCLLETDNELWLGTNGAGLYHLNLESAEITTYSNDPENPWSIGHEVILSLFETRDGTVWVGTGGAGLKRFDPQTSRFTHYQNRVNDRYSLSDDTILQWIDASFDDNL